jgi:hypothetical protein
MKVNLKAAARYYTSLITESRSINLPCETVISAFSIGDPIEVHAAAADGLEESIKKAIRWNAAAYEIRALIGKANAERGVNELLAEKAKIGAEDALLSKIRASGEPVEVSMGKLEAYKRQVSGSGTYDFCYGADVSFSLVGEQLIANKADRLARNKRRLAEISEQLLVINTSKKIELPQSVVDALIEAKIIEA